MKKQIICLLIACFASASLEAQTIASLASPNKLIEVKLIQSPEKQIQYQISYKSKEVIAPSSLGFTFKKPVADLRKFNVIRIDSSTFDETWSPILGEVKDIRNQYKQLSLELKDAGNSGIIIQINFRIYDDGIGFRYNFPKQDNLNHFIVDNEWSTFKMTGDHTAFWIPGDYDTNEYTYSKSKLSEIDASAAAAKEKDIALTSPIGKNFIQSPLMLKSAEGLYINVHEAALLNYPVMHLQVNGSTLTSQLTPDAVGNKAYLQTPFSTPWRTLIIADKAEQILASKLILNLNEPSKIKDSTWIKGQKFVGMWWEMHVGKANWPLASGNHDALPPRGLWH